MVLFIKLRKKSRFLCVPSVQCAPGSKAGHKLVSGHRKISPCMNELSAMILYVYGNLLNFLIC